MGGMRVAVRMTRATRVQWLAGCKELTWRSRTLASEVRPLTQLPGSAPGSAPAKAAAIRSR